MSRKIKTVATFTIRIAIPTGLLVSEVQQRIEEVILKSLPEIVTPTELKIELLRKETTYG